jgi:predicted DNA-binding protein (MmcQ/YjbR family)
MVRTKDEGGSALERLRAFGLRYPGAHTKSPWPGHLDLAVNDKTFAYLSIAGEPLKISCKLPRSADAALELPFTTPAAYGLGKSGWVTAEFPDGMVVPVELLEEWIDESYRAQAPKRLSAGLPPFGADASPAGAEGPRALVTDAIDVALGKPAAGARSVRSTVKHTGSDAAVATAEGSKRAAGKKAAQRAVASASKASVSARGVSKRQPLRAGSAGHAKRDAVSPRAAKAPAKKRARSRA